jgi:hypothetical protein
MLFDGTDRGLKSHSSIEGLRPTAPDLLTIRIRADQAHQEGPDASPPNKIRFRSFLQLFLLPGNSADVRALLRRGSLKAVRLGYGNDSGAGDSGEAETCIPRFLAGAARDRCPPA